MTDYVAIHDSWSILCISFSTIFKPYMTCFMPHRPPIKPISIWMPGWQWQSAWYRSSLFRGQLFVGHECIIRSQRPHRGTEAVVAVASRKGTKMRRAVRCFFFWGGDVNMPIGGGNFKYCFLEFSTWKLGKIYEDILINMFRSTTKWFIFVRRFCQENRLNRRVRPHVNYGLVK